MDTDASASAPEAAGGVPPLGSRYLSTEVMPAPEGTVHALAVISEDLFVSGDDGSGCFIWQRAGTTKDFTAVATIGEHGGAVRAIVPISAGVPGFPFGGFATACMDKKVRLFSLNDRSTGAMPAATLVNTLTGHFMGVISLGWTHDGCLISGGWDGIVRVWDVSSGACLHILEGHENGTSVLGLPNGSIAVGSTGRKDDKDQHVDYQIRIWSSSSSGGFAVTKRITDHEQAVRDLALLKGDPEGGWVSVGNDGAVKLRNLDGTVRVTFLNPVSSEGKPFSAFRVNTIAATGEVVTANEDNHIRVYSQDGSSCSFPLPGTPWSVNSLPNSGDIVVGCGQAGTSKRGHVYVFSSSSASSSSSSSSSSTPDYVSLAYQNDMLPPAKGKGSNAGAGSEGGGSQSIKITGPYEAKEAFPGQVDGQYGFFKRSADGAVMVCAWSAEAGMWVDVGEMQSDEAAANSMVIDDDSDAATTSGGSSGAGGGGGGGGGGGKKWDYTCGVTMDTKGGMRSLQLRFNEEDDPMDVAQKFCEDNNVPLEGAEQVCKYVMERKMEKAAKTGRVRTIPSYRHFPASAYVDLYTIDFKKANQKLLENNALLAGEGSAVALTAAEAEGPWAKLIAVLEATAKYHSSTVPRAGVKLLVDKLLRWPLQHLLPVVDTLRLLVLHSDGVEALHEVYPGGGEAFLSSTLLELIHRSAANPELRGVTLTLTRVLFNSFRHARLRDSVYSSAGKVIAVVKDTLLPYEHATVKAAASNVLYNFSTLLVTKRRDKINDDNNALSAGLGAAALGGAPVLDIDISVVQQTIVAVIAGLNAGVKEEEPVYRLITALGTLVAIESATLGPFAKAQGADAALAGAASVCPASQAVKEASIELRSCMSTS